MYVTDTGKGFQDLAEASLEVEQARQRVRDLQPIFVPHQVNEINHPVKVAKKNKTAKAARKKNRPAKKWSK